MKPNLLTEALGYHWKGWPVVAARRNMPIVKWMPYQVALPTDDQLSAMPWDRADGLALVIGDALYKTLGKVYLLDIEAPHRDEAERWLDRTISAWREGMNVESGGGGLHVYCRSKNVVTTTTIPWGDIKGRNSVAYLPPTKSRKTGRLYRWLSERHPIHLEPDRIPGVEKRRALKVPRETGWAAESFRSRLDKGSGRRLVLPELVGYLRGHGVDRETAVAIIELWDAQNVAPLGLAEVRKHVEDMYSRYGMPGAVTIDARGSAVRRAG